MFTFGDIKVILLYEWGNEKLFTHCTKYFLRVDLGKGVKVKGKGNVLEILKVSQYDK